MNEINTFGAVMEFAIELERRIRDYASNENEPDYSSACGRRISTLERVRRENVVEIMLEPIQGLSREHYVLDTADHSQDALKAAAAVAARYYADAAPKINVLEAKRALERCGKQHSEFAG